MEKLLLSYEKHKHDKALIMLEKDLEAYNYFLDVVIQNTDKIEPTLSNINLLINDAKGFIFDLIVDKSALNFNGLPISKKKAMELVEFPKNLITIILGVNTLKQTLAGELYHVGDSESVEAVNFEQLELRDGKIYASDGYLENLKQEFSIYTTNEKQTQAVISIRAILEHMSILRKLGISPERDVTLETLGIEMQSEHPKLNVGKVKRLGLSNRANY